MEGYPMKACFTSQRAVLAAAGGLVIALFFSGVAQAITDNVFRYSTPKTGYYSIDHLAVTPLRSNDTYQREFDAGLHNTGAGQSCFGAGINLPHGATLKTATAWYRSNVGGDPTFYVVVQQLSTAHATVHQRSVADDSGTLKTASIPLTPLVVINNNLNSYAFVVCIYPSDVFYSARLIYTVENAGD
jgi:hypothetical protein